MIDIHHHCLPAVDDGPRSWDDAVELCRIARGEGIETIIATPHVLRGLWAPVPRRELEEKLARLTELTGGTPRLLPGSEYYFAHDMDETLARGTDIIPLAGSRYVLVELAANAVPAGIEGPFFRASLAGWTSILAHPERNIVFQQRPDLLARLVGGGIKTQITAGSLTGAFGQAAARAAEVFLERGLVHFVATDAHTPSKRPPLLSSAREVLVRIGGEALARALTLENPAAVVAGRGLPWDPEPQLPAGPDGFFTRIRAFFSSRRA